MCVLEEWFIIEWDKKSLHPNVCMDLASYTELLTTTSDSGKINLLDFVNNIIALLYCLCSVCSKCKARQTSISPPIRIQGLAFLVFIEDSLFCFSKAEILHK